MKTKSSSHTISEARKDLIRKPALFITLILMYSAEQKDDSLSCEIFYGEEISLRTYFSQQQTIMCFFLLFLLLPFPCLFQKQERNHQNSNRFSTIFQAISNGRKIKYELNNQKCFKFYYKKSKEISERNKAELLTPWQYFRPSVTLDTFIL